MSLKNAIGGEPAANPEIQQLNVAEQPAEAMPAGTADGVVTDAVADEEVDLVNSFLDNLDAPSSDDILAQQAEDSDEIGEVDISALASPEVEKTTPTEPAKTVEAAAPPTADPATPPVEQVVKPTDAPAADPAKPAEGQPAAQAAEPSTVNSLAVLAQEMESKRDSIVENLAKTIEGTFTEADIQEFQENPRVALSKMGARQHVDIVQNTLSIVAARLPAMVAGLQIAQQQNRQNEDSFYTANPDLTSHRADIDKLAVSYRKMNPQMPTAEFVADVAAIARQRYLGKATAAPAAPQAPAKAQPFTPASGAAPSKAASTPKVRPGETDWSAVTQILDADDMGFFDR